VRSVGVEVDARDVAAIDGRPCGRSGKGDRDAVLVTLEEEVRPVVVARIGAAQAAIEDEVGILVGLGLRRLDVRAERRQVRTAVVR
jgi:hypothetical protein